MTSQLYSSSDSLSLISWGAKMISGETQSCSISQLSSPSLVGHHSPCLIRLSAGCGQQHPLSLSCLSGDGLIASLPKPTLFHEGDCERPPHIQHGTELSGVCEQSVNLQLVGRWRVGRDTDNGQRLGLRQACGPSVLTGNSFLVADTLVEAAPELFAPVPGDVIVTDVIERDVTHCKAQTSADLAGNTMEGDGRGGSGGGGRVCQIN